MSQAITTDYDPAGVRSDAAPRPENTLDEIRRGGLTAIMRIAKADKPLAYAVASTIALLIAGFGPQANTTTSVNVESITVGQVRTHSIVPGWSFIMLAVIAGTGLCLYLRSSDVSWLRLTRITAGVSIAASVVVYLQTVAQSAVGIGGVGWGFVIGLFAAVILATSSRVIARRTTGVTK